jgi:hypothetical protein
MNNSALWLGLVGAPIVWLAHLEINYSLTPSACHSGQKTALIIVTAIALVLTIVITLIAWRSWRVTGATFATEAGDVIGRCRFMALAGLGVSAIVVLLVLANFFPIVVLGVCD